MTAIWTWSRRLVRQWFKVARTLGVAAGLLAWRRLEPSVRDTAGWLIHRAPGALGQLVYRLMRWLPGALVRLVGYAVIGAAWCMTHLAVYCVAYPEYAPVIKAARDEDRPRRVYSLTQQWRRSAVRRCCCVGALGTIGWLVARLSIATCGSPAAVMLVVTGLAGFAAVGRIVRPRRPEDMPPADLDVPENAPYPIADAHTRAEAADCVARALAAENIALRLSGEAQRTRWGWTVPVILRTGTPAAIVARTGELETHLDLPAGGVLATPDRTRRARVVLRLAQADPFADLGYAPPCPRARCPSRSGPWSAGASMGPSWRCRCWACTAW